MTKAPPPRPTEFAEILQSLAQLGQNFMRIIETAAEAFKRAAPGILSLIEAVNRMPDVLKDALVRLADEGWYMDWEAMSLQEPAELAQWYLAGQHQEVEDRLVEHYRRRLLEIEEELVTLIPTRAHIFRQVFVAHRQGLFYLTVPTLLAQADGVCVELLGEHYFMRPPGNKAERFAQLSDLEALTKALLAPFFTETSIRLGTKKRPEGFDKLNRHLVLHGESFDYGTEVRSLQAVAFLYYVAVTLARVLERHRVLPAN
nr:hypothetical protein [uncultured Albidiferax sp.]